MKLKGNLTNAHYFSISSMMFYRSCTAVILLYSAVIKNNTFVLLNFWHEKTKLNWTVLSLMSLCHLIHGGRISMHKGVFKLTKLLARLCIVISSFLTLPVIANDATQQCENVYKDNMSQFNSDAQTAYAIEEIAKNECNSDGTAVNVGYSDKSKSLLGGLTDKARNIFGSYSKTTEFCSDYKSGKFSFYTSASYERKPLKDLASQFNACMQIASNYNYAIWNSSNGPSETVFHGQYFVAGNSGVFFNVLATYNGAKCYMPDKSREVIFPSGSQKKVINEFTLICRRNGTYTADAIMYNDANVLVFFNGQPYPISMPADKVFRQPGNGPKTSREALGSISNLSSQVDFLTRKNKDLMAELETQKSKKYYSRIAYVGEHDIGYLGLGISRDVVPIEQNGAIIHFTCGFRDAAGRGRYDGRNEADRQKLGDKMQERICASKPGFWVYMGHAEGNNCGYDSYIVNCQL